MVLMRMDNTKNRLLGIQHPPTYPGPWNTEGYYRWESDAERAQSAQLLWDCVLFLIHGPAKAAVI